MESIIRDNNVNEVYHLAALLSATGEKSTTMLENQHDGLMNVLELARKYKFRIFAPSSIAVFGADVGKYSPSKIHPSNPATMYGITKVAGELMADYYHSAHGVDIRGLRYPWISWKVMPGGGTTDYAVEIFYKAVASENYTCFVNRQTRLPMMYMMMRLKHFAVDGIPSDNLSSWRLHLLALNFTAEELYDKIREKHRFRMRLYSDHRQEYADSWPDETDGTLAEQEWGFKLEYDLDSMCNVMIQSLRRF